MSTYIITIPDDFHISYSKGSTKYGYILNYNDIIQSLLQ